MSRIFQPFSPNGEVLVQNEKRLPRWIELSVGLEALTLIELREKNAHWFSQSIAFELTKPMLWLVNIELTRRRDRPPMARRAPVCQGRESPSHQPVECRPAAAWRGCPEEPHEAVD